MLPLTTKLEALVNGDLSWLSDVSREPTELVERAWLASAHPPVTLRAVSSVLSGIKRGTWDLGAATIWAYFVMHGGFPRPNPFNRSDLDIEYDPRQDELIAELVMRLERSQGVGQNPLTAEELDAMRTLADRNES